MSEDILMDKCLHIPETLKPDMSSDWYRVKQTSVLRPKPSSLIRY